MILKMLFHNKPKVEVINGRDYVEDSSGNVWALREGFCIYTNKLSPKKARELFPTSDICEVLIDDKAMTTLIAQYNSENPKAIPGLLERYARVGLMSLHRIDI